MNLENNFNEFHHKPKGNSEDPFKKVLHGKPLSVHLGEAEQFIPNADLDQESSRLIKRKTNEMNKKYGYENETYDLYEDPSILDEVKKYIETGNEEIFNTVYDKFHFVLLESRKRVHRNFHDVSEAEAFQLASIYLNDVMRDNIPSRPDVFDSPRKLANYIRSSINWRLHNYFREQAKQKKASQGYAHREIVTNENTIEYASNERFLPSIEELRNLFLESDLYAYNDGKPDLGLLVRLEQEDPYEYRQYAKEIIRGCYFREILKIVTDEKITEESLSQTPLDPNQVSAQYIYSKLCESGMGEHTDLEHVKKVKSEIKKRLSQQVKNDIDPNTDLYQMVSKIRSHTKLFKDDPKFIWNKQKENDREFSLEHEMFKQAAQKDFETFIKNYREIFKGLDISLSEPLEASFKYKNIDHTYSINKIHTNVEYTPQIKMLRIDISPSVTNNQAINRSSSWHIEKSVPAITEISKAIESLCLKKISEFIESIEIEHNVQIEPAITKDGKVMFAYHNGMSKAISYPHINYMVRPVKKDFSIS